MSEIFNLIELFSEQKEEMSAEEIVVERDNLITQWEAAKTQLDHFKALELELRNKCVAWAGNAENAKGTEYVSLHNGYAFKIDKKVSYELVKDEAKIAETLEAIRKAGNDGAVIAASLIKQKQELSLSFYNSIPPSYREIASSMVESKSATPTVSIVEPKRKKQADNF